MRSRDQPHAQTTEVGPADARSLDEGAFRGAAPTDGDSRARASDWVDFYLPMGSGIVAAVDIEGIKAWAMVDTGASISVIDEDLAKTLNLGFLGAIAFESDVAAARGRLVKSPSIRLGQASLLAPHLMAAPLSSLRQTLGRKVSLIIGQDAFATRLLDIDLPNRRLSLRDRSRGRIAPGFRQTALWLGPQGRRCIQVSVEGVSLAAVFDLGSSNPVMLSKAFASRAGFLKDRRLSSSLTNWLGGVALSTACRLRDVTVAGFEVSRPPAEAFETWMCDDAPANIGLPVFQDFRVIVDLAGERLWLARTEAIETPFRVDRSGLGLALERDGLRVMHVAMGGPAEAAGWQVRMRITAVDGHLIGSDYVQSGLCEWRYGEPGRVVQLTTEDGREHRLELKEYI